MIYLKNIREKQTVYIPRTEINSKVVVIKSYDEGYADGIVEGKKLQKLKLTNLTVSENGVYKREDGWNEVKVDVEIPENIGNTQEKTLIVTKDIDIVVPDSGYDAMTKVSVNATQYGQNKRNEGYDKGFADGKAEGGAINLVELYETPKSGDGENNIVEYKPSNYNADGFSNVKINITSVYHSGYTEGNTEGYNHGYNEGYEEGVKTGQVIPIDKINIFNYGVNLKLSTFTEVPNWVDFEGVVDYSYMFGNCEQLTHLKYIDTSNVTTMAYAFNDCKSLTSIELIPTGNVKDMQGMFSYCKSLQTIPLLDTSNVENMLGMFGDCTSLQTIPQLNTSKTTSTFEMFRNCTSLQTIPQLDLSNVIRITGMFYGCTNLTSLPTLNLSGLTFQPFNLFGENELEYLTEVGGFQGLRMSITDDYSLVKLPNLTTESCNNILNGLFNFRAFGIQPNEFQGKLKVHQNFLNKASQTNFAMAMQKGWTITA